MNFQICGRRTALTSIQLTTNLRHNLATRLQDRVQDVNDLMQHLTDVWAGVEQSIIDDVIDQRRRRLSLGLRCTGGHFEYLL